MRRRNVAHKSENKSEILYSGLSMTSAYTLNSRPVVVKWPCDPAKQFSL